MFVEERLSYANAAERRSGSISTCARCATIQCDPPMTYDWTADSASAWTIPMGADVGRVFKVVSQDFSLQVGTYGLLKRPDNAPQWIVRVNLTLLFPRMH